MFTVESCERSRVVEVSVTSASWKCDIEYLNSGDVWHAMLYAVFAIRDGFEDGYAKALGSMRRTPLPREVATSSVDYASFIEDSGMIAPLSKMWIRDASFRRGTCGEQKMYLCAGCTIPYSIEDARITAESTYMELAGCVCDAAMHAISRYAGMPFESLEADNGQRECIMDAAMVVYTAHAHSGMFKMQLMDNQLSKYRTKYSMRASFVGPFSSNLVVSEHNMNRVRIAPTKPLFGKSLNALELIIDEPPAKPRTERSRILSPPVAHRISLNVHTYIITEQAFAPLLLALEAARGSSKHPDRKQLEKFVSIAACEVASAIPQIAIA